jgi:hypothetical protein
MAFSMAWGLGWSYPTLTRALQAKAARAEARAPWVLVWPVVSRPNPLSIKAYPLVSPRPVSQAGPSHASEDSPCSEPPSYGPLHDNRQLACKPGSVWRNALRDGHSSGAGIAPGL